MCKCTPTIRTPWCGKPGCEAPARVLQAPSNGLSALDDDEIDDITIDISRLAARIEALGRHRSYSTAVTKLDEARHWMRDRKHRAP